MVELTLADLRKYESDNAYPYIFTRFVTQSDLETVLAGLVAPGRLEVVTLCEHGEVEDHYICDEWDNMKWAGANHDEQCKCPGGSRREVGESE